MLVRFREWYRCSILTDDECQHLGFGSDLKFHLHVHCLITFGGLNEAGEWVWPRRKKRISQYREMCHTFRAKFIRGLESHIKKGSIKMSSQWPELKSVIESKRWNVRSTYPTMETALIENYLSRYINRVAISRNRFKYISDQHKVSIIYNDYKNQIENKAAPKKTKHVDPLIAIHQIVQYVLPPYFQKSRYYGLHATATFRKLKDQIPSHIIRNGQSIRTLFQILNQLLKITLYQCEQCKSENYELIELQPDRNWARCLLPAANKSPPINGWHITSKI